VRGCQNREEAQRSLPATCMEELVKLKTIVAGKPVYLSLVYGVTVAKSATATLPANQIVIWLKLVTPYADCVPRDNFPHHSIATCELPDRDNQRAVRRHETRHLTHDARAETVTWKMM
jgi:hypothetical protein